ncbi:MAG: riboflavin biosynthesis protein RibF [Nitrospirae bacterium RBG_19FT_COMBO_58_9]|nr:MAG: riboflavin biosynthesis protein RibF [Nitrospirae bacterium RBG_19FT_COMBO_58_9]
MKVTRGLSGERSPRAYPVATIGNFDGHHLGHRALLQTVVETARKAQGTSLVLTFDPHPVKILAPQVDLRFLTSPEEKLAHLEAAGIDEVVFLDFTPTFAAMSPEQFAEEILHRSLGLSELFVGNHFAFGKGRAGRIDDLVRLGGQHGFRVHPVTPVMIEGDVVSSTRIRQLIQSGNVDRAATLLGRVYGIRGTVVHGLQQGQAMGWPTANLRIPADRVVPSDGVYAARTIHGTEAYDAIAYIGTRPTFGAGERLIEVNLLDQNCDLYGQEITVQFVERVRGDHTFASADELSKQISRDVEQARNSLRRLPQGG